MIVNEVMEKITALDPVIEMVREGESVDKNILADFLEEYQCLLANLPVSIPNIFDK